MSLYTVLQSLRPQYQAIELERLIVTHTCKTVLDLGCGSNSNLSFFKDKITSSTGMDICESDLKISKKKKIHDHYILDDVMNAGKRFKPKSFDCVMAIGLVEHLPKKQALKLMTYMETIAKKLVIVGTPNGFIPQEEYGNNPYQVHQSGFVVDDFTARGYEVLGMDGPKLMRGENAKIKWKPVIFFSVVANIVDPLLRTRPADSFNLLAYKKL